MWEPVPDIRINPHTVEMSRVFSKIFSGGSLCPHTAAAQPGPVQIRKRSRQVGLLKAIARFPEELKLAGRDLDPSQVNRYLTQLAGEFHRFYTAHRIKGEEPAVAAARLKLADTTRSVLANGLNLIGVAAPEKM